MTVGIDSSCLVILMCLCTLARSCFLVIENSARYLPTCLTSKHSFFSIQICPFSNGAKAVRCVVWAWFMPTLIYTILEFNPEQSCFSKWRGRVSILLVSEVTRILNAIQQGDRKATGELLPAVYEELRRLAGYKMAHEAAGHTLQPTALVHEAWLRLGADNQQNWQNRVHFFAAAAEAMRRILV